MITILKKKSIIVLALFFVQTFVHFSFSQCVTVNAGGDQTICSGSANLTMTYTPVKATTSYTVATTTYAWDATIPTGGTTAIATSTDDVYSSVIPIGFCFQFYGVTYTQCVIGSNGLITFTTGDASAYCPWSFSAALPSTALPKNSIMAPFHDIDPSVNPSSGTSDIKYKTLGTAPCRTFIVSWSNTPMFSCTSVIANQQLILYETTNYIDVMVKSKPTCSSWNGGLAILGIQNATATLFTAAAGKNSTVWTATNEAYRFSPAGAEISTVKWLQGATQLSTTTTTSVSPTATTTYTAQLTVPTCAAPGTLVITDDVVVNVSVGATPTFAPVANVCQNSTPPVLPTTSTNSFTGTWSPAVSTATIGTATYTFTPAAGQCATTTTINITTVAGPPATFAPVANVCQNATPPVLPITSTNSFTGTWAPAVSTAAIGTATYTFTPNAGQCAAPATLTVTTIAPTVPTFNAVSDVCLNSSAPVLPTNSTNTTPIPGTWAPTVSTAVAGTAVYTFTPASGQCATTANLSIVTTTNILPTFAAIPNVCQGATAPVLPLSSTNTPAISGTWSPTVTTAVLGVGTYTFTPAAGQCAINTTLNITVSTPVLPTFAPIANVCQNATAPVLPATSTNAFTGTWSPTVSTATTGPTTYTFTPSAGMCATNATLTITIDTPVTPTFSPVANVCQNATAPVLPNTSTNLTPFNGAWSPAVSTAASGPATYTFTPTAGQCAANTTLTLTVDALIVPTFAPVSDICINSTVPVLPTSSTNSAPITGAWSPVVSSAVAGTATYTFTPTSGQCAANTTLNIITTSTITPTFAAIPNVCQNAAAPVLPVSSTNAPAINGVWAPAVSTATVGASTYTFTPNAGQCGVNTTTTVTVSTPVLPTFTPIANVCQNATAPVLLTTSLEAITGSWSPVVSTATTGPTTYTFTPSAGMCATNTTLTITIDTPILPAFAPISSVCQNATAPVLLGTSNNSISGTWSPAVSTASAGTASYTFTPTVGQCASTTTLGITVNAPTTPTFAAIAAICQNSTAPVLPSSSTNAITGAWAPAVSTLSAGTGVYTFTPSGGQCATNTTLNINVIPLVTPTFAAIASVCQNSTAPVLNTSSTNMPAIVGTWSPSVSTALAGSAAYTFTPSVIAGVCAVTTTANITVTPLILPLFETPTPLCQGAMAPVLPTYSNNIPAIMGAWSPMVSTAAAGTFSYAFTPTAGQCASNTTLSMVIKPNPVLLVTDPAPICAPGEIDLTSSQLTAGSTGTITFSTSPAGVPVMSNPSEVSSSGTYFVMSNLNGCVVSSPITVVISASPIASFIPSETILDQYNLTSVMVNSSTGASSYEWFFMDGGTSSETDPSHIFPDSIYGDQLITMIATSSNGCKDTTAKIVTINEELIFYIPNAFTPDGDTYNQTFQPVFRSGFDPNDFTMLLFNRWGEVIFESHDASVGWDGTFGGNMVQDDVITWVIEFKIIRKDKHVRHTGHVNILR